MLLRPGMQHDRMFLRCLWADARFPRKRLVKSCAKRFRGNVADKAARSMRFQGCTCPRQKGASPGRLRCMNQPVAYTARRSPRLPFLEHLARGNAGSCGTGALAGICRQAENMQAEQPFGCSRGCQRLPARRRRPGLSARDLNQGVPRHRVHCGSPRFCTKLTPSPMGIRTTVTRGSAAIVSLTERIATTSWSSA